jgi:hypothetical protein
MGLSFCFFALAAGTFGALRSDVIEMKDIAPTIFAVDVAHFQTRAYFSEPEDQHKIAIDLINKGFFDRQYSIAGFNMIDDLVINRYAPAQTTKADILMRYAQTEAQTELAMALYQQAAAQDYAPAMVALDKVKN